MKKIYILWMLLSICWSAKAQYTETFSTPNKGYLINLVDDFSGVDWTLSAWANQPPVEFGRDAEDYLQTTASGVLGGIDLDQEVCWTSPMLVATTTGTAAFTTDITWTGYDNNQANPLEFINVEYQLNGGAWQRHPNVIGTDGDLAYTVRYTNAMGGNDGSATTNFPNIAVTMGDMIVVRVCWSNNSNVEVTTLDNVSVTNVSLASACLQPTVVLATIPTGSCNPNTGSIKVTASNATPGYQVSWSGPGSGDPAGTEIATSGGMYTISSLAAGTYMVTVTDATGCSRISSTTVSTAAPLSLSTQVLDADCPGQSSGEIDLTASNGVAPYSYSWSHLPGSPDPEDQIGLANGMYLVTVTDQAGCTATTSATVGVASSGPYLETFSSDNKGYLINQVDHFVGVNWTLSSWDLQPPVADGRDVDDFFRTSGGKLATIDLDQEVCWTSPLIDIQGVTASASADLTWIGLDNDPLDYIDFLYSIDAGPFVQLPNQVGGGTHTIEFTTTMDNMGATTVTASGLTGNSLQVRICVSTNANAELVTIDNVSVPQSLGYFCPTEINISQGMMDIDDGGSFDYGNITLNTPDQKAFTIANPSAIDLLLTGTSPDFVVKGGMHPADFIITQPASSTITGGNNTTFSVSFTPSGLGARSCTLSIPNNDPDENPYDITLNGNGVCPTITFTTTPTNACSTSASGQIAISNVTGGTTPYMFSDDNGASFQSEAIFTGLTANTYQIVIKDANMCLSMASAVLVGIFSSPTCSIAGLTEVCSGTNGISYDGPAAMSSYAWSISGNGVISGSTNGQTVTINAGATGSYTVTLAIEDANGCTSNCMQMVTVHANPTCSIAGITEVCSGSSGISYDGPAAMSTYAWAISGNGVISGANDGQTVLIDAGGTGSFTLTLAIEDVNGCMSNCMQMVTVHANPTCSIVGVMEVCSGTSGISYDGPAAMSSYAWSISGNGSINGATDGQNVVVDAGAAGIYTLSLDITDANDCVSTCMEIITVNGLPTCDITGAPSICTGTTGHGYSAPAGMSSYAWSIMGNGTINGPANTQNVIVDAGIVGNLTLGLMATNINGCINNCTYMVTVNAQDDPLFNYSKNAFCKNETDPVPLISGLSGGTFVSMPSGLIISSTTGTINLATSSPGSYAVRYTTDGPCSNSSSQLVKIDQVIPLVNAGLDQQICGLSTTLAGNVPTIGTGSWSIASGSGGVIANPASPGSGFSGVGGITYILKWTITNGACSIFDLVSITLQSTELSMPVISGPPTICPGLNNIPYSVAPQSGVTNYVWSYSGSGVVIHSNGGTDITVDFNAGATSGQLSVLAINPCGGANVTSSFNIQLGNIMTCSFVNCLVSNLLVSDNTLIFPGSPQIFKVSDQISSNATLPSPKTFLFKAGETVNLLPGFKVNSGAIFVAEIEDCPVVFPFQSGR
ncbi:MAG: choice-of-anchor D domain-containing protein [Saprospiraceae bacterium]|nr:choice-of-anchor D domain-containing protein [Saprospiraceae bacterium]